MIYTDMTYSDVLRERWKENFTIAKEDIDIEELYRDGSLLDGYDPNQERDPEGTQTGGQFSAGKATQSVQRAQAKSAGRSTAELEAQYEKQDIDETADLGMTSGAPLTREENQAVYDYTSSSYLPMNRLLRRGESAVPSTMVDETRGRISVLDRAISKQTLKESTTIFRGVKPGGLRALFGTDDPLKIAAMVNPGAVIRDKAFMSFSKEKSVAVGFGAAALLELTAEAGTLALDAESISEYGEDEREIILPRNTALEVLSYTPGKSARDSLIHARIVRAKVSDSVFRDAVNEDRQDTPRDRAEKFQWDEDDFEIIRHKVGDAFDPQQKRDPKGTTTGGQFSSGAATEAVKKAQAKSSARSAKELEEQTKQGQGKAVESALRKAWANNRNVFKLGSKAQIKLADDMLSGTAVDIAAPKIGLGRDFYPFPSYDSMKNFVLGFDSTLVTFEGIEVPMMDKLTKEVYKRDHLDTPAEDMRRLGENMGQIFMLFGSSGPGTAKEEEQLDDILEKLTNGGVDLTEAEPAQISAIVNTYSFETGEMNLDAESNDQFVSEASDFSIIHQEPGDPAPIPLVPPVPPITTIPAVEEASESVEPGEDDEQDKPLTAEQEAKVQTNLQQTETAADLLKSTILPTVPEEHKEAVARAIDLHQMPYMQLFRMANYFKYAENVDIPHVDMIKSRLKKEGFGQSVDLEAVVGYLPTFVPAKYAPWKPKATKGDIVKKIKASIAATNTLPLDNDTLFWVQKRYEQDGMFIFLRNMGVNEGTTGVTQAVNEAISKAKVHPEQKLPKAWSSKYSIKGKGKGSVKLGIAGKSQPLPEKPGKGKSLTAPKPYSYPLSKPTYVPPLPGSPGSDPTISFTSHMGYSSGQALTASERSAVVAYTGSGYSSINRYLRTGDHGGGGYYGTEEGLQEKIAKLDAAMAKHTIHDQVTIYRGLKRDTVEKMFDVDDYKKLGEVAKPGVIVRDKAFMSFSKKHGTAEAFGGAAVLEVVAEPGTPAMDVENISSHTSEREVILPRDRYFEILEYIPPVKGTYSWGSATVKARLVKRPEDVFDSVAIDTGEPDFRFDTIHGDEDEVLPVNRQDKFTWSAADIEIVRRAK